MAANHINVESSARFVIVKLQGWMMPPVQSSLPGSVASSALMVELLAWVAAWSRTYGETMEAWRTSCPRMPAWEDAIDGGFIQVLHSDGIEMNESAVRLTPLGQAVLAEHR